jgi:phage terminase large subunit-like protein
MREMGYLIPVKFINSRSKSKDYRIEALAPKYEWGKIYHLKGMSGIDDLEDELIHFPKAKNDDLSDSFATVLDIAAPPMRNRVQQGRIRDRKNLFKKLNTPRSPMIGY